MVEIKSKACAKTLCGCRGPYHNRHTDNHDASITINSPATVNSTSPVTATATTTVPERLSHQNLRRTPISPQSGQLVHHRLPLHPLRLRYLSPQSKMGSGPHASRIVRKYRRSRLKRVKRQEYRKLREMVPALHERPRVSKVEVIEEAIKYIDELHTALIQRFRARGLPAILKDSPVEARDVHGGNIRELVRQLLATSNPASLPPSRIENARTLPSFMHKISKARRL